MLAAACRPAPFSDRSPWEAGDLLWATGGAADWAVTSARAAPWVPHPLPLDARSLQRHIDELEQQENALRSLREDCLKWQAQAVAANPRSSPASSPERSWPGSPLKEAPPSRVERLAKPAATAGAGAASASKGAPLPAPLSSLPSPLRVPLGPSRPPPATVLDQPVASNMPPGLLPPPGLTLARAASLSGGAGDDLADMPLPGTPPRLQLPPGFREEDEASDSGDPEASVGITVMPSEVGGVSCTRVEWNIEDFRGKLQASMGRPLVSPPFAARLPNLRLMVFPDAREAVKTVRSRERKGMYAAMVKKGPLYGALKLKADCLEKSMTVLRFHLVVGEVRKGPFTYDFSERAIAGCDDFGHDWLKQVDESTGNLRVGVEILED